VVRSVSLIWVRENIWFVKAEVCVRMQKHSGVARSAVLACKDRHSKMAAGAGCMLLMLHASTGFSGTGQDPHVVSSVLQPPSQTFCRVAFD
jgi:hypothetical protein